MSYAIPMTTDQARELMLERYRETHLLEEGEPDPTDGELSDYASEVWANSDHDVLEYDEDTEAAGVFSGELGS